MKYYQHLVYSNTKTLNKCFLIHCFPILIFLPELHWEKNGEIKAEIHHLKPYKSTHYRMHSNPILDL